MGLCISYPAHSQVHMQLAGAGAGAVGGALLGRASDNNKQGAQGANVQNLGGLGTGGQPGGQSGDQPGGQPGGQFGGQRGGQDQQPPAAQISNVLNGGNGNQGNQGSNGNGGNGRNAGNRDSRANTGDPGGRSAADIAATSPQSNVFRQDARTAATNPREHHPSAFSFVWAADLMLLMYRQQSRCTSTRHDSHSRRNDDASAFGHCAEAYKNMPRSGRNETPLST